MSSSSEGPDEAESESWRPIFVGFSDFVRFWETEVPSSFSFLGSSDSAMLGEAERTSSSENSRNSSGPG